MLGVKANLADLMDEAIKYGLTPIARKDALLFILGSLPGDASLAAERYYAHPTNQFWRLLGNVIGEDLHSLAYDARLDRLAVRQIGLWDVIGSANRKGSLDQAIREAQHNRLDHLLQDFPSLRAIGFNGSTAAAIGRRLLGSPPNKIALVDLPSSSAANTRRFEEKASAWLKLSNFLEP